ncbi:MAG: hypothetical protein CSA76_06010, partial [Spirochaetales bacterium]
MKQAAGNNKLCSLYKGRLWPCFRAGLEDKAFMRRMLRIAGPICLHMLLVNGVTVADTMMISRLGETAVAAVGLANQMFFLVFLAFFGITSGTSIFVAQFWGDKDREGISHVMGISLIAILFFAVLFALAS